MIFISIDSEREQEIFSLLIVAVKQSHLELSVLLTVLLSNSLLPKFMMLFSKDVMAKKSIKNQNKSSGLFKKVERGIIAFAQ